MMTAPIHRARPRFAPHLALFAFLASGLAAQSIQPAGDSRAESGVIPSAAGFPWDAPTKAQNDNWYAFGREPPTPEFFQPPLDSDLPAFVPRPVALLPGGFKSRGLYAHFKCTSSDITPNLVVQWIAAFEKYYPNVRIDSPPTPYGGRTGGEGLIKGTIDIAFVSRELRPKEDSAEFNRKFGYDPASIPVSGGSYRAVGQLDCMVFFVHKDNPLSRITFKQLDRVFSSTHHRGGGPITKWGELGLTGDWADKPINLYGAKPWNGFEEFLRQWILNKSPAERGEWRDGIHYDDLVFPITRHAAQDRYCMGYTGMAFLYDQPVKVLDLSVGDDGPYYPASYEEVVRARYPLTRLIYANVNKAPGKRLDPALEEFIRFILSREGQRIVIENAVFIPLREFQAAKARAMLEP